MTDETVQVDTLEEPTYLTTRETLDAWLLAGWPTEDAPDWTTGGYVTKERAQTALRLLANRIDELSARLEHVEEVAFPPIVVYPPAEVETPPELAAETAVSA